MKVFFITNNFSSLADEKSEVLEVTKKALLKFDFVEEVNHPTHADILLIQEKYSYKDYKYIKQLLEDPIILTNISKVFTLNFDTGAAGFLRGLYSNLPKFKLDPYIHATIPYTYYYNSLVFSADHESIQPKFLATWRGNLRSHKIRSELIRHLGSAPYCLLEATGSWLNHDIDEKKRYVDLILNGKFSLCPAGFGPTSFRIYESMALGRCPVIIADNFVPPKGPNWQEFALFFPETKLNELHSFLLEHEASAELLGAKAKEAWNTFFCKDKLPEYYANSLLTLIRNSPHYSNEIEIKRLNSFTFNWNNEWTVPQRIIRRIKLLVKSKPVH